MASYNCNSIIFKEVYMQSQRQKLVDEILKSYHHSREARNEGQTLPAIFTAEEKMLVRTLNENQLKFLTVILDRRKSLRQNDLQERSLVNYILNCLYRKLAPTNRIFFD